MFAETLKYISKSNNPYEKKKVALILQFSCFGYIFTCVCVCMLVLFCIDQRFLSGISLNCSLVYCLKQGLSLYLDPANSARWAG